MSGPVPLPQHLFILLLFSPTQDNVSLCDASGCEFARGLVNLRCEEARAVAGRSGRTVTESLGFHAMEEVVHRCAHARWLYAVVLHRRGPVYGHVWGCVQSKRCASGCLHS